MSQETIGLGSAKYHIFVMGAKINNNITSYYYVCSHNFSNIAFQTFISYIVIVYPLVSSAQQIMIAKNALVYFNSHSTTTTSWYYYDYYYVLASITMHTSSLYSSSTCCNTGYGKA